MFPDLPGPGGEAAPSGLGPPPLPQFNARQAGAVTTDPFGKSPSASAVDAGPDLGNLFDNPSVGEGEPPNASLPAAFGGPREQDQLGPAVDFSFDPAAPPPAPEPPPVNSAADAPPPLNFDFADIPAPPPVEPQAASIPDFSEDLPAPMANAPGGQFAGDLPVPVGDDLPAPILGEPATSVDDVSATAAPPQLPSLDFGDLPPVQMAAGAPTTREDTNPPSAREASPRPAGASLERLKEIYEGRMAAVTVVRNENFLSQIKQKIPLIIVGAAAVMVLLVGLSLGFTRYGVFGFRRLFLPRISEGSSQFKKLEQAHQALLVDTFDGYQQARDLSAELLRRKAYPEAQAVWCQAIFYLSRKYGAASADDLSRANALLDQLLLLGEKHSEVLKANANSALSTGYLERALALLQDGVARSRNASDLDMSFLLAEAYSAKSQPKLAMEVLTKVLAKHKDSAKGLHALGDAYRALKQLDKAAAAYSDALSADPNHLSSAVELASIALLNQKNPELAASNLATALKNEDKRHLGPPELARAHALKGILVLSEGKPKDAISEFEAALKLDPKSILAKANLGAAFLVVQDFERAAAAYKEVTDLDPQNADFAEGYLSALVSAGKVGEAVDAAKRFNAKFPGNARIAYQDGRVQEAAGYTGEAESSYKRAIGSAPDFVEARVSLGRFYLRSRRLPEAKSEFEQAASRAPKSALVRASLGEAALAEKELDRAKSEFDLSIALDSQLADGYVGLSRIAFARAEYQAARAAVEQALHRQPRAREARLQLGLILWKTGDAKAALAELMQAKEQEPKSARVMIALGAVMLDKADLAEAESSLTNAITVEPSNPEAHFYLAKVRAKRAEYSLAIDSMKTALERVPDNPLYHYELGLIYRDAKRTPEAQEEWKRTVELDPSSADAYHALGQAYLDRGDFASALSSFEKALAADPRRVKELELAGDCYFQEGKWDQAITRYTSALKSDPRLKSVFYKLGRAFTEKGKHHQAIEWYQKAAEVDSDNPMTFYYLGYLYKEKGRRKEAIVAFKDYLAKRPSAEDKQEIEDEIYDLQH